MVKLTFYFILYSATHKLSRKRATITHGVYVRGREREERGVGELYILSENKAEKRKLQSMPSCLHVLAGQ